VSSDPARPDPIQAVTLDVGGTLIEPWPSVGHIYSQTAADHGSAGIDPDLLNDRFRSAWHRTPGFSHTKAGWAAIVDATFGGLCSAAPSTTFFDELYQRFASPKAWRVYDDVAPFLAMLKRRNLRLGIISNWDERLAPLLTALDLAKHFEVQAISCAVGYQKPGPEIFHWTAAQLDVAPERILHVGDRLREDAQGALAAGYQAVWLARNHELAPPGIVTVTTLSEVAIR
jgi:putative hydrolase of the HAD superfamily